MRVTPITVTDSEHRDELVGVSSTPFHGGGATCGTLVRVGVLSLNYCRLTEVLR